MNFSIPSCVDMPRPSIPILYNSPDKEHLYLREGK
jgi:hypothetical protein